MKEEIRRSLGTTIFQSIGKTSSGCISSGNAYRTDNGIVFVKTNAKEGAATMFQGEFKSLTALKNEEFPVPKPLIYGNNYLVVEYIEMNPLSRFEDLAIALANLHQRETENTGKFGFDDATCCGFLPLNNAWCDDWPQFYASQRIQPLVQNIQESSGDRKIGELWNKLAPKMTTFFKNIQVKPSLLHGDLWSGNVAESNQGPIAFDPASFYGHSEFDLAIAKMFGGFPGEFFTTYHRIIPKESGFERRQDLYLLFHHLNHWAHFGDGYREGSLKIMRSLCAD